MKNLVILIMICLQAVALKAHPDTLIIEDISIVDSNLYNGRMIYVFNDGSWEYKSSYRVYERHEIKSGAKGVLIFSKEDLYGKNFKNYKISAYDDFHLDLMADTLSIDIKDFMHPCPGHVVSSEFKFRWGRWHNGIDFSTPIGTSVKSSWGGVVRYAGYNSGGYGNVVVVRHDNGLETLYAHLSRIDVKINQRIEHGFVIGLSGNTGHSTGPHLHYEIRFLDNAINPMKIIKGEVQEILPLERTWFHPKHNGNLFYLRDLLNIARVGDEQVIITRTVEKRKGRRTGGNF
jgi:murein DD-endopeptidase MepM/ murein hydrolase activator NlpD